MIVGNTLEALTSLPESAKSVVLAFSILMDRLRTLPAADRDDLFAILMEWPKCEDEESRSSLIRAMEEILAQVPLRAVRMELPAHDGSVSPGLRKWGEHAGGKIKEVRVAAGLTQEQLAGKSGLTQSHLSRLERGDHSPNNYTLEKIAKALGIEIGQLDPSFN